MKAWDKVGLREFKRGVRKQEIFSAINQADLCELKKVVDMILVWLAELEEEKEKEKKE